MKNYCLWVLLVISFCVQKTISQVIDFKKDQYWASAGGGLAVATGDTDEICYSISFNHSRGNQLLKARILGISEFDIFGDEPLESSVNFGVLVGNIKSKKFVQTSFLLGVGFVTGVRQGEFVRESDGGFSIDEYEVNSFFTLSVPAEVEFIFKPVKFVGIGLRAFLDVNIVRPSVGVSVNVSFGKLR